MNFFAFVDQCQNLGNNGYSGTFTLQAMPRIEKVIKDELHSPEALDLFNDLEKLFFGRRTTTAGERK